MRNCRQTGLESVPLTARIFQEQRLNVVEHDIWLQVGKRIDFANYAITVYQEHLQHVMQGSGRVAAVVRFDADVLTEIL